MGDAIAIRAITVKWPSGRLQVVEAPAMNRPLVITEPARGDATASLSDAGAPGAQIP